MHTQISSSNVKGAEKLELTLTPANNLEREFFNALFNNNGVKVEQIPNSEDIVIRKMVANTLPVEPPENAAELG